MITRTKRKNIFCRIVEFVDCQVLLTCEGEIDEKTGKHWYVVVVSSVISGNSFQESFRYDTPEERDNAFLTRYTRTWLGTWVLNQKADLNCKQHYAHAN